MDGYEWNKIIGAVFASLLVVVCVSIVTKKMFSPDNIVSAYAVSDVSSSKTEDKKEEVEHIMLRLAKADAEKGSSQFRSCSSCHTVSKGDPNRVGPNLYGIVGRDIAKHDDFKYSSALSKHPEDQWTFEALDKFLENPRGYVKGTSMGFRGIQKPMDRANLLLWLNEYSDSPLEIVSPPDQQIIESNSSDTSK